jgi:hypothetical protein
VKARKAEPSAGRWIIRPHRSSGVGTATTVIRDDVVVPVVDNGREIKTLHVTEVHSPVGDYVFVNKESFDRANRAAMKK